MTDKWLYWFEELDKEAFELVGKKCANLGEMTRSGLPVPPGFAVTVDAYKRFMEESGAAAEIRSFLSGVSEDRLMREEQVSRDIRDLVEARGLPPDMEERIADEYQRLADQVGVREVPVAVRSSGSVSMPGQMETHLNVRGPEEVFRKIVEVWGSTFTHQAVSYRAQKGLCLESFPIGVGVMKVVNAKCAGVAFSAHPNTGDRNKMVIEANWGLGEGVVGGDVTPDRFVLDRTTGRIHETINKKHRCVVPVGDGTGWQPVETALQTESCISEEEVRAIAALAERLEKEYGDPQDIEWVIDQDFDLPDSLRVVQTRPVKMAKDTGNGAESQYLIDLLLNTVYHQK